MSLAALSECAYVPHWFRKITCHHGWQRVGSTPAVGHEPTTHDLDQFRPVPRSAHNVPTVPARAHRFTPGGSRLAPLSTAGQSPRRSGSPGQVTISMSPLTDLSHYKDMIKELCDHALQGPGKVEMRVSEYFDLNRSQPTLDFVDIHTENDVSVFIEPDAIRNLQDDWGQQCEIMISTFFDSLLDAAQMNDTDRLEYLLFNLSEPNETHLGWSKGVSQGRGLGRKRAEKVMNNLRTSKAAKTGLLQDLEDSAVFVHQIGPDIVSDITTNVIRGMLISYTQGVCDYYGIPLEEVPSGPVWHPQRQEWENGFALLPVATRGKLLLVPKVIARYRPHIDGQEYYRYHLVPNLQSEELDNPASRLVRFGKDGKKRVDKKDVEKRYPFRKSVVTDLTIDRRHIFEAYKARKSAFHSPPLNHSQISGYTSTPLPDYGSLLNDVLSTPVGTANATKYHRAIEALLTAIFYPSLSEPKVEDAIHEGRKRIDISYTNTAPIGFFRWLRIHGIPCRYVVVECKNYGKDLENPELDQISSRFSPLRGQIGLLTCRGFKNKQLFMKRCRDTALDHRGYVIPLDDDDLKLLVEEAKKEFDPTQPRMSEFSLLKERFDELVS